MGPAHGAWFVVLCALALSALTYAAPRTGKANLQQESKLNSEERGNTPHHTATARLAKVHGRIVKRSADDDDDDEGWGVVAHAPENPGGSESGSGEDDDESIKDGIAPAKGPYFKLKSDGSFADDDDGLAGRAGGVRMKVTKPSFRSWDEYLQNQRGAIMGAVSGSRSLIEEGSVLRPVIHSDDHFRFMDKLFKSKNDRRKRFHALLLFMREQGKEFRIPQNPKDKTSKRPKPSQSPFKSNHPSGMPPSPGSTVKPPPPSKMTTPQGSKPPSGKPTSSGKPPSGKPTGPGSSKPSPSSNPKGAPKNKNKKP